MLPSCRVPIEDELVTLSAVPLTLPTIIERHVALRDDELCKLLKVRTNVEVLLVHTLKGLLLMPPKRLGDFRHRRLPRLSARPGTDACGERVLR